MLIPSDRHTTADLECWRELESGDHAHAPHITDKEQAALSVIRAFSSSRKCYAGFSGGKDSTVLAHLVLRAGGIPLVHLRAIPLQNPDIDLVVNRLGVEVHNVDVDYRGINFACKREAEEQGDKIFFRVCRDVERTYGARILGIRADESRVRYLRMCRFGADTEMTCAPLGWWNTQDVFAYLAKYDLPIHPAYAMLGGGRYPRERIRVDELGGERGDGSGRAEWEREYYGDVLARLGVA